MSARAHSLSLRITDNESALELAPPTQLLAGVLLHPVGGRGVGHRVGVLAAAPLVSLAGPAPAGPVGGHVEVWPHPGAARQHAVHGARGPVVGRVAVAGVLLVVGPRPPVRLAPVVGVALEVLRVAAAGTTQRLVSARRRPKEGRKDQLERKRRDSPFPVDERPVPGPLVTAPVPGPVPVSVPVPVVPLAALLGAPHVVAIPAAEKTNERSKPRRRAS